MTASQQPPITPGLLYQLPYLGFLLAMLAVIVGLWIVEMVAPDAALPFVFLVLLGVVVVRPGLVGQLKSLFGG